MSRYIIIVAGGKGLRMGGDLPKQFIPMAGKPLLMHTVEAFHRWDAEAHIVLALPVDHQAYWAMLCREIGCKAPHAVVNGGATRFHSVKQGLDWVCAEQARSGEPMDRAWVAVHDGVRPFVTPEMISRCFAAAEQHQAAIPVVPMIDSLREREAEGGSHPVDRSRYVAVQTPQVFALPLLKRAYEQLFSEQFTDDASVVEALGEKVAEVEGLRENIKVTTPFDLIVAQALFDQTNACACLL